MIRPALIALVLVAAAAPAARAGDCPDCTTAADCPDGFCVVHDGDVGCGADRALCCPGQACNTFSGRPSCEDTASCAVMCGAGAPCPSGACVESPLSDASWCADDDGACPSGSRFAASAGDGLAGMCVDDAAGAPDAAPEPDGSAGGPDAADGIDAAVGGPDDDGGCGCRLGGRARVAPLAAAAALALLVALRRRR